MLPGKVVENLLKACPGYGQLLTSYHTKQQQTFDAAMEAFLTPSCKKGDAVLEALGRSRGRDKGTRDPLIGAQNAKQYTNVDLKTRQIKLDNELSTFLYNGTEWPKGCHFPLCVCTRLPCRRSKEAYARRYKTYEERSGGPQSWTRDKAGKPAVADKGNAAKPAVAGKRHEQPVWDGKGKGPPVEQVDNSGFFKSKGKSENDSKWHDTTSWWVRSDQHNQRSHAASSLATGAWRGGW